MEFEDEGFQLIKAVFHFLHPGVHRVLKRDDGSFEYDPTIVNGLLRALFLVESSPYPFVVISLFFVLFVEFVIRG